MMTASAPGVVELWKRSFGEIRRNAKFACFIVGLFLVVEMGIILTSRPDQVSHSDTFVHFILFFFWLKTIQGLKTPGKDKNVAKGLIGFSLYVLLLILALIAGGFAGHVLIPVGAFGAFPPEAAPLVPILIGISLTMVACVRFLFVFPATAFLDKTSLPIAFRQSRGWSWRLLMGVIPFFAAEVLFITLMVLGLSALWPAAPFWALMVPVTVFGVLCDLALAGYLAHAYKAAVPDAASALPAALPA